MLLIKWTLGIRIVQVVLDRLCFRSTFIDILLCIFYKETALVSNDLGIPGRTLTCTTKM